MKKKRLIKVTSAALSLLAFLGAYLHILLLAAPSGALRLTGDALVEGNIFYVGITLDDPADVWGVQGVLKYDNSLLKLLEFVPQSSELYAWDMHDRGGEVAFLIYENDEPTDSEESVSLPAVPSTDPADDAETETDNITADTADTATESATQAPQMRGELLFNAYFQIEKEPDNGKITLTLDELILTDGVRETVCASSTIEITVVNYLPPQTTAPETTPPESVSDTTTAQPDTEEKTQRVTQDIESVSETAPISDTAGETDEVITRMPDVTSGEGDGKKGIKIVHLIIVSVLCAAISGTAVYFVMKGKNGKKDG